MLMLFDILTRKEIVAKDNGESSKDCKEIESNKIIIEIDINMIKQDKYNNKSIV